MNNTLDTHLQSGRLPIRFTYHEDRLLMVHTDFMSQQFPIDKLGIEVVNYPKCCKIGFWHGDGDTYQSLYIVPEDYGRVYRWFKKWGWPVPQYPVLT